MRIRSWVKILFKMRLGYRLNLRNPRTYCEKIQWLKFFHNGNDEKLIARADKYRVRSFIESKGFGDHLVPLYGSWDRPEDIEWQKLPNRFVLKLNNGSGPRYSWFVKDKTLISKTKIEAEAKAVMFKKFGEARGQFHYGKMPPKLMSEAYLEDGLQEIKDYKFYCFHGKIAFFSVEHDASRQNMAFGGIGSYSYRGGFTEGKSEGQHVGDIFDIDWKRSTVKFFGDCPRPKQTYERPDNFDKMVLLVEALSQGYPHIRVDLYNLSGKVFFGELTYTPENGFTKWDPPSLDLEYGQLMDIHRITH